MNPSSSESVLPVIGILLGVVIALLIGITVWSWAVRFGRWISQWLQRQGAWNRAQREAEANGRARRAEHREAVRGTLTLL